jgi:Ca-activated chloride channel family protein
MNFISPLNFLFAGTIGALLLLYVLRLKRKERIVSSTLLWHTALRDLQANAPWQKLRSSLLMWLQILFLVFAIIALSRPAMKVLASGGQTIAIIVDSSASMNATDVAPSRFGKAQSEASRLINALSSGDEATLISAANDTRVLAPLTANKNVLKRAIGNAKTSDTSCNLREAIVLAASLLRAKKSAQIYVLSDGAVAPVNDLDLKTLGLQFVKIGTRNDNVAITAMDVRRGYSGGAAQVFVTIRNFSDSEKKINLELSRDGELVSVKPITISAGGIESQLFDAPFESGLFGVGFDEKDDLAADNAAYANLEAPRAIKVLLLSSEGNLFLEKALNVDPNVQLTRGSSSDAANGDYDVIVCDGIAPANPKANQLVFNTFTALSPVEKLGFVSTPSVADWDRKHPVSGYASWNDVRFARTTAVKLKSWGQSIVESESTPLVVAGEKGGKRIVWCGFDVRETDLPLRVAFPIFINSSLRWLSAPRGGSAGALEGAPIRAGETVALSPPTGSREINIAFPDKSTRRVTSAANPFLFSGADKTGIYTASAGNWKKTFGVNLLNKTESDLKPRDAIQVGTGKPVSGEGRARANKELWGYLALIALVLLGVEWWIYHRGV